ncbi:MAG TPA: IPT/TIG domain-containing protein [Solirubrobacteraceae bacterium]|jgi:alpha-tubulin suppressor-like RCC1 family protein|nr:IPT/TIG domain-containing protein [Solirubrobacteraceae bacterium]
MARMTRLVLLVSVLVGCALPAASAWASDVAPQVTLQPIGATVEEGQSVSFEASASGVPTPTVQWQRSGDGGSTWGSILKATSDKFTIADAKTGESGDEYRAVFSNGGGKATSSPATLIVQKRPTVTRQPVSITVEEGQSASFEASASGSPTPTVQWELSSDGGTAWSQLAGADADQLTIVDPKISEDGDEYRAVFTNAAGQAISNEATLSVHDRPVVTGQPTSLTVEVGQSVSFEASATGYPTPSVQWERSSNGGASFSAIAGASSEQLTVAATQASENGYQYRAVFTNVAGNATSEAATLTVATHHFRVLGWGQNVFGALGDGSFSQSDVPIPASGLNFVTAVAAGRRHSLALLSNGTVVAWGEGASGQLGDGEFASSDLPVAVEDLSGVKAIAAGENFSLALLTNGTVMAWGANESGQLGDGNTTESDLPVAVKGLSGVTAIAAGGEHALALLSNGTVTAWGNGEHGELGDGEHANRDVSGAVKALTGVAALAAGGEHSLALLDKGTVMAWGDDEFGQLGNSGVSEHGNPEEEEGIEGGERFSSVPVAVDGVSGATAVAAGAAHSLALLANGTVMGWGENEFGELGDGTIVRGQETPAGVSGLTGVTAIAASGEHSLALLANGTVMSWGEDRFGELGDGSAGEPSDVPVPVSGLSEVAGIAAGGDHDLVYSEPLPSVIAVVPAAGPLAGGTSVTITGANFAGATAVDFGSTPAKSFVVHSASSITAVAPAGSLGVVNVTVTTPAGISPPLSADRFDYVAAPVVKSLSVKKGPGAGRTTLTITGANLEGASAVRFGSSAAESFTVNSAKSITAVSPAGAGTVDVTVTTAGGTSATVKGDEFQYTPAVETISPDSGPASGAGTVTITGAGFAPGSGATVFKFASKVASGVECASTSVCTATVPAGKVGTVTVSALVGKLKSPANSPGDLFTYE